MKKNKQVLIRLSDVEYNQILELSIIENKSISSILRDLITYRYNYMAKQKKITCKASKDLTLTTPGIENNKIFKQFLDLINSD